MPNVWLVGNEISKYDSLYEKLLYIQTTEDNYSNANVSIRLNDLNITVNPGDNIKIVYKGQVRERAFCFQGIKGENLTYGDILKLQYWTNSEVRFITYNGDLFDYYDKKVDIGGNKSNDDYEYEFNFDTKYIGDDIFTFNQCTIFNEQSLNMYANNAKFYYFRMYVNNKLVLNLEPVVHKSLTHMKVSDSSSSSSTSELPIPPVVPPVGGSSDFEETSTESYIYLHQYYGIFGLLETITNKFYTSINLSTAALELNIVDMMKIMNGEVIYINTDKIKYKFLYEK